MVSEFEDLRQSLQTLQVGSMNLAELNTELRTTRKASKEAIKKLTMENIELRDARQTLEVEVLRGFSEAQPPDIDIKVLDDLEALRQHWVVLEVARSKCPFGSTYQGVLRVKLYPRYPKSY
ncbi:hypothetical protein GUJ93_ZPchr0002g25690 [Zizania palustris]|uniref:Uncharacterized protein n=1 Tax=Zizania palustris TaxID=103762 RepID=A0A8J5SDK6_ZIZPA|nr:hypothetical protein GUJ93_ZPchr0002g25690 [Zizania palustris]